ncbi:hypothetical protein QWT69_15480 [Sporosarcina oncorhynchi]|uniref:Uncharacterized protein n=1 Tax=Sporosarcina oncorhynchi TaxID=3056444 RepID=A0ABZ0L6E6_9BACL|nr:hypothetical protein [Sporosarcina sp. T2O-4]WOV87237.1 hypothetical protein QWT69_15480 [Sporosarcina sp. T2O-4]
MEVFVKIILVLFGMLLLYLVIFAAVKDAIEKSEVGKLLIMKYGDKKMELPVSDEEIEKEFDERF